MRYIGVDIGGMSIKAGIVDETGAILCKKTAVTEPQKPSVEIVADIAALIAGITAENGYSAADIDGIGIGVPGSVYDEKGIIRYTCNINFRNVPIADMLRQSLGIDNIKISNDANCAVLAETMYGAAKGASDCVMITIGTGLGTGIIADGRMITGNRSAGSEGGHIYLRMGGERCGCGKKGHFESYASATALLKQTEDAAKKHPESLIAKLIEEEGLSGKTLFTAMKENDKTAIAAFKRYIKYLGAGIVSFANIFYPEIVIIGGGISNEGDTLIKPLQRYVSRNVYGAEYNPKIKVVAAALKNDAGIIGAAALAMQR